MNEDQLWRQCSAENAVNDNIGNENIVDESAPTADIAPVTEATTVAPCEENAADDSAPDGDIRKIAAKTAENARLTADAADIASRLAGLASEIAASSEDCGLREKAEEIADITAKLAEDSRANAGEAAQIADDVKTNVKKYSLLGLKPREQSEADNAPPSVYINDCFYTEHDEATTAQKRPLSTGGLILALIALVAGIGIFCAALVIAGEHFAENGEELAPVNITFQTASKPKGSTEYLDSSGRYTTEGIAKYVRPVVVEIYAYEDRLSTRFSGASYGSGVILTEDGYIVTNTHIIEDAEKVTVVLFGDESEKELPATIIGKDSKTDIAVIKIDKSGLPCAVLGNSDEVVCGEHVCAVGNPEGLNASVTSGLVSAIGRGIRSDINSYEMSCIQSDAALSPGNSGGALVNMYGQVIGITSSKYVESYSEGLGFAITVNDALPIIEDILKNGYVTGRVRIGITFKSVSEEDAEKENTRAGIHITDIAEECDIANTELQPGDIIVRMNGVDVTDYDEVNEAISGLKGGDKVRAHVLRKKDDGTYTSFDIVFELMTDTSGKY